MSSRVLRKLLGGRDAELKARHGLKEEGEEISEDEEEQPKMKNGHFNPFDLLNQSQSESEVKDDDEEDNEHTNGNEEAAAPPVGDAKQKKKKRRKKKVNKIETKVEKTEELRKAFVGDAAEQKLAILEKKLLSVELKHLNPNNEMRRTFGKHVVKAEPKRGRSKLVCKKTYLAQSREIWPTLPKDMISMKIVPNPSENCSPRTKSFWPSDREIWFTFEHSQYYQNVQYIFLAALESSDSDSIISVIRRYPYHVDALIQVSEMCKMIEEYATATEFIERAVYVLESSLHPSFNLTSGNSRLDYCRKENRSFFIVLFKYAMYLDARACCRTAFEISKLILSLSPDMDPLAMVLVLDYYALRNNDFEWVVSFYETYESIRYLSQLPNMAYSYALALFCLGNDMEKADKALQYALITFPSVYRLLMEELSMQVDKSILNSSYFGTEVSENLPLDVYQLVVLYVIRAKVVWRQKDVLPWLERNVQKVLCMVNNKDPIITESTGDILPCTPPLRYILRHIILSDEKVPMGDFIANEREPIFAYDPLPPENSFNSYENETASDPLESLAHSLLQVGFDGGLHPENAQQYENGIRNRGRINANGNSGVVNNGSRRVRGAGIVNGSANGNAGNSSNGGNVGNGGNNENALNLNMATYHNRNGAQSYYQEFARSFGNLVDSMRDFISTHSPPNVDNAGENGNDDTDDDEESTEYFYFN